MSQTTQVEIIRGNDHSCHFDHSCRDKGAFQLPITLADLPTRLSSCRDMPMYLTFNRQKDGTLLAIHDELYVLSRLVEGRSDSPSEVIVDSQSVKTATMIAEAVGYDAAKKVKGRKRHLTIDTLGLVLRVLVTAADMPEREGGKRVLKQVQQRGHTVRRVHTVWGDGGYDGQPFYRWAIETLRWVVWVVLRPEAAQGFVLLKKRWKVERTFGWFNRYRRLSKDYSLASHQ